MHFHPTPAANSCTTRNPTVACSDSINNARPVNDLPDRPAPLRGWSRPRRRPHPWAPPPRASFHSYTYRPLRTSIAHTNAPILGARESKLRRGDQKGAKLTGGPRCGYHTPDLSLRDYPARSTAEVEFHSSRDLPPADKTETHVRVQRKLRACHTATTPQSQPARRSTTPAIPARQGAARNSMRHASRARRRLYYPIEREVYSDSLREAPGGQSPAWSSNSLQPDRVHRG